MVNLSERLSLGINKLFGDQLRRLSFAIALTGNPDILFLDEPTSNMGTRSRM